ncbi:MNT4 putative alpha-1 [Candida maltosa Xu316]
MGFRFYTRKTILLLWKSRTIPETVPIVPLSFDILKARQTFNNPILSKWSREEKVSESDLETKCKTYFGDKSLNVNIDYSYPVEPLVYKRKKWLKDRVRALRKEHKQDRDKYDFDAIAKSEFAQVSKNQSDYEHAMANDFDNMRIYGKCFTGELNLDSRLERLCSEYQKKLYPWMSGKWPRFEDSQKQQQIQPEGCMINQLAKNNKGKGIVIPILPNGSHNQINHVSRLIRVLRGLDNKLPIQIMYVKLSEKEKQQLMKVATSESQFPRQDISFVNLSPAITIPVNNNLMVSLSSIFSTFEEMVILGEHTIPLVNIESLFKTERYLSTGMFFFKPPSHLKDRVTKFNPGFHEVAEFIKSQLPPSNNDVKYFGFQKRKDDPTIDRFFKLQFNNIIDPSLILINKSKVLSGLLMATSFELYDYFKIRVSRDSSDHLWIGQLLSGTTDKVTFNFNYAVSPGIFTPAQNVPKDATEAQEICSSSWGQVAEVDDISLIYVTSHQLENWLTNKQFFESLLRDKYLFKVEEEVDNIFDKGQDIKTNMDRPNDSLFRKIQRNPLTIETFIKPPTLSSVIYVHSFNEPDQSWVIQKDFDNIKQGHPFYCVYDTVGNPLAEGVRGTSVNVNEDSQKKYLRLFDIWVQDL